MQLPFEIDYVFPWVNDTDKIWRKVFTDYCKKKGAMWRVIQLENERFRDWGLLKFLLRSIAKNMPWIRKLHLIVSNIEQVPQWINQENVDIVLHEQIIPQKFLPTFNSTAIEMFLPYIPNLAEHFVYANDDMYIMNPCEPNDFFTEDGRPKFQMRHIEASTIKGQQYRVVCANQWWKMASKMHIKTDRHYYMRQYHGITPLVKTKCFEALEVFGQDYVYSTVTNFRQDHNMNQYIYTNYCALSDYKEDSDLQFEYCGADKPKHLVDCFASTKAQILCANDCSTTLSPLQLTQLQVLCAAVLEHRFPEKCKYEN